VLTKAVSGLQISTDITLGQKMLFSRCEINHSEPNGKNCFYLFIKKFLSYHLILPSTAQSFKLRILQQKMQLPTTIVSYNVNGIRAAVKKGFLDWMEAGQYDVVCIQETKCQPDQGPIEELEALGYHHLWHSAVKKGYSGVATFSKVKPDHHESGCGNDKYDSEGRILRTDFGDWTLLNCYFPSGTSGSPRQDFKYEFLDDFSKYVKQLKKTRPQLIIVGDYNIAHQEIDIHNPKGNKKSSGFLPEERQWMTDFLGSGFTDTFRHLNPESQEYSWWSYRFNCRAQNKGWRIDYQCVTDNLQENIRKSYQLTDVIHSDHCPVLLEMNF